MNQVFKYIRDFYQKEFNFFYLLLVMTMLGVMIYFNYWHGLEKRYVGGHRTKWLNFAGYYLLYFVPFATAFFLQLIFFKNCSYYKNSWFWVILFLAPAFFSFRVNFDFHAASVNRFFEGNNLPLYRAGINYVVRVFAVLIPVVVLWYIKDRSVQPLYGTRALDNVKPYLLMLLIMLPLIAWASTQKDFLHAYPKAQALKGLSMATIADKWRYVVFELCYGFDFLSIEMFFRGFLILSLMHICGQHCIIPTACFYCAIHFGKPMAEAISSFFGGLLLGIVSYNTLSIWGGLLVHLGIAWLMEIGGFVGNIFKGK